MAIVEYSEQETKKLINDMIASKGDNLRIRVMRRRGGGTEVIASFDDARAEHVAYPEKWLPELAGGGAYVLHVFHGSASMDQIGGGIALNVDNIPPRNVDLNAVESASWEGPRGLTFPKRGIRNGNGFIHLDGRQGEIGADVATGPQRPASTPISSQGPHDGGAMYWMEKAQQMENAAKEERRQREVDAIRREANAQVANMQSKLDALAAEMRNARNAPPPHQESLTDALGKALGPFVPMFTELVKGSNEIKIKMMEIERQNHERALLVAKEQSEQLNRILTTMMDRKGIDPTVQAMLDQFKEMHKRDDTNPILNDVIKSFSMMAQSTLQVMTAATDAGLVGQRESGVGEVVAEVARAAGAAFEAFAANRQPAQLDISPRPPRLERPAMPPRTTPPLPRTAFQRLDRMIRVHHNVVETAALFLDGVTSDGELNQRFAATGNDIEKFFAANWMQWAQQDMAKHGPYVQALGQAVVAEAQRRGMVHKPAPRPPAPPPQPPVPPVAPPAPEKPFPEQPAEPIEPDEENDEEEPSDEVPQAGEETGELVDPNDANDQPRA